MLFRLVILTCIVLIGYGCHNKKCDTLIGFYKSNNPAFKENILIIDSTGFYYQCIITDTCKILNNGIWYKGWNQYNFTDFIQFIDNKKIIKDEAVKYYNCELFVNPDNFYSNFKKSTQD